MIPLPVLGEFLGTFIMMLLGEGVICSVVLNKTKSYGVGWLQTATGWAMAITLAVYVAGLFGPAHLNPAVSIALAFVGETNWADVPAFILAQFLGAMLANVFVWLHFFPHWKETTDTEAQSLGIRLGTYRDRYSHSCYRSLPGFYHGICHESCPRFGSSYYAYASSYSKQR